MRKFICLCITLCFIITNSLAFSLHPETLNKELAKNEQMKSVVSVRYYPPEWKYCYPDVYYFGTAFFITDSYLITAAHVVQNNDGSYIGEDSITEIRFLQYDENLNITSTKWYKCNVVKIDILHDMALLQVLNKEALEYSEPIAIAETPSPINVANTFVCYKDEFTIGSIQDNLVCNDLSYRGEELVTSADTEGNNLRTIVADAYNGIALHGMSGGPVINSNNEVVGMIYCSAYYNGREQCFAINYKYIIDLYQYAVLKTCTNKINKS